AGEALLPRRPRPRGAYPRGDRGEHRRRDRRDPLGRYRGAAHRARRPHPPRAGSLAPGRRKIGKPIAISSEGIATTRHIGVPCGVFPLASGVVVDLAAGGWGEHTGARSEWSCRAVTWVLRSRFV